MSEHPTPLSDDDLSQVVGGAASPGSGAGMRDAASLTEGGDMFAMMAMFQSMAQEMRNTAREVRGGDMASQVNALKDAADQIKDMAGVSMNAALLGGAMSIASGAHQMGAGIKDIGTAPENYGAMLPQSSTAFGIGASMPPPGAYMPDAKTTEMQAAQEAQLTVHQNEAQHANDVMQQMMDIVKDVRDKLSAVEQSKAGPTRL